MKTLTLLILICLTGCATPNKEGDEEDVEYSYGQRLQTQTHRSGDAHRIHVYKDSNI